MKPVYSLMLITCAILACSDRDDDSDAIPNPGKNIAGSLAGSYKVKSILSSPAGASTQTAGAINGSGTVTLTTLNDSTVSYRNQTELTVVATGKKITLDEEIKNCRARLSGGYIYLSQSAGGYNEVSVANMVLKNRLNVSRTKRDGYDLTIEYSR